MSSPTLIPMIVFCLALPLVSASDSVQVTVLEKSVTAQIQVAGVYECTLSITFENVIGLTQNSIQITAVQVNPLDLKLLQRLGGSSLFSIPAAFPVLINVSPTAQSTLSFTGVVEIELSTSALPFDTRFRLFSSPNGGNFSDITTFSGIGSYRVRGTSGDFSDFLIALDLRTQSQVVDLKFSRLQSALNTHAPRIGAATLSDLQVKLQNALTAYQAGNSNEAVNHLLSFVSTIQADNGETIPNTYRANDPNTVNVAGDLRKHAGTLIFSLRF